ncbi:hypothetical protein V8B97DRAFT_1969203 [Scleroderma yunnanense]
MSWSLQNLILNDHPTLFFTVVEFFLSILALGPLPSFIPLIFLVSVIRIHGQRICYRQTRGRELLCSWVGITAGSSIAHRSAASTALSSPLQSFYAIIFISGLTYLVAIAAIYLDVRLKGRASSNWGQITLFPFLWATIWSLTSHASPVGRLLNWSPILASHPYNWLTPILGPAALDWLVAAWASLVSEFVALWLMGFEEYDSLDLPNKSYVSQRGRSLLGLGTLLLALTIPSFTLENLPNRADLYTQATALNVGCVLPRPSDGSHPTLDDFIAETAKMTSAKVVLWPESSVIFHSEKERETAFEKIRRQSNGAFIGVAFEQYVEDDTAPRTKNGLAIIHRWQKSGEEAIQYYKRQLVPLTESFSKIPSVDPPAIHRMELKHPRGITAPEWAPAPNFTRSIPFTTSICLDLASPTAFTDLASRPALILAPARTWETTVGLAMWEQAKTRAAELGSMVLWCDGGVTGVSGIGGQGIQEIMQVGAGSWTRTIGIPWPLNEGKTIYATLGEFIILMLLAAMVGSDFAVRYMVANAGKGAFVVLNGGQHLLNKIPVVRRMVAAPNMHGDDPMAAGENREQQHLLG